MFWYVMIFVFMFCSGHIQSLVPARFETRTVTGLVKGHAYSVTAVEEVKPKDQVCRTSDL